MATPSSGTVDKALDVLDLIAAQERPVRFGELQRLSPLPKATLYRLVQTLVNSGMVVQNPDSGAYSLGVRLVRLAHAAWRQASLAPIARPHIDALARSTGLTVHLAQMDYGHVLYLDRRDGSEADAGFSDAGKIAPAYCTGVGKAMLAHLPPAELDHVLGMQSFQRFTPTTLGSEAVLRQSLSKIRARGYAVDREEYQSGVLCVASAILSGEGRPLGAVSLSGSADRIDMGTLEGWVPRLAECVEEIAEEATQWAFPVERSAAR
ncbi:IclR family transcriptional regulator [Tropicimonas isoalkanivorans]|uniref:Transcriptional regulator, IclR family n=1 Tax=Tropicimonas isoalkanivorans TaxID=441112 RepID=A0A1I1HKD6_9RHOB|nr:IclR family transcriptional regulator [Tropicimonas isoalkanivorans]SFC24032.1 transcriptional regulator, IclR family [Tropicimonas isoalkanivorans]